MLINLGCFGHICLLLLLFLLLLFPFLFTSHTKMLPLPLHRVKELFLFLVVFDCTEILIYLSVRPLVEALSHVVELELWEEQHTTDDSKTLLLCGGVLVQLAWAAWTSLRTPPKMSERALFGTFSRTCHPTPNLNRCMLEQHCFLIKECGL